MNKILIALSAFLCINAFAAPPCQVLDEAVAANKANRLYTLTVVDDEQTVARGTTVYKTLHGYSVIEQVRPMCEKFLSLPEPAVGMDGAFVLRETRVSMLKPTQMSKTKTAHGDYRLIAYEDGSILHFENGVLIGIQD